MSRFAIGVGVAVGIGNAAVDFTLNPPVWLTLPGLVAVSAALGLAHARLAGRRRAVSFIEAQRRNAPFQ
jgi:hypothetical protein